MTIDNGAIQFVGANDGVYNTGTLIIGEAATLESTLKVPSGPSANRNYSTLVVNDSGHITTGGNLSSPANSGIATYGGEVEVTGGTITTGDDYGAAIDIYSSDNTVNGKPANVTISGGTITSDIVAVSTNNVQSASSSLTITGGTISTGSTSIYWPTSGTLTIGDKETGEGPTITSKIGSAIEICSGSLNVYGGTLKGGVGQDDEAIYNTQSLHDAIVQGNMTSGYIGIGDAITVFANRASSYAAAPLSVNIAGGTFSSAKNYGIRLFDNDVFEGVDEPSNQEIQLEITGGTFSGNLGALDAKYLQDEDKKLVTGGTFERGVDAGNLSDDVMQDGSGQIIQKPAEVNGVRYKSVQDAIDNATNGQTVTLVANVTESVNIPANKTLTLDLNGFTLTNEDGNHTINNYGVLTVNDSAGGGAVDNVSHGRAALYNYADATAVLNGGTFKRSKETGSAGNVGGGNSWYTIRNKGMMTLNSGVAVESLLANGSLSKFSSVICNGFNSSEVASEYKGKSPTLIIDGATIRGGLYVKNDYYGTLEMRSGDVRGSSAGIFNYADATISGGTVSVDLPDRGAVWNYAETASDVTTTPTLKITGGTIDGSGEGQMAVRQSVDGSGVEPGAVTISGGEFKGSITADSSIPTGTNANIHISGGTFTSAPNEEFLADGLVWNPNTGLVSEPKPVIPSKPTYSATVAESEHGAVKVSPERAKAGDGVTITATPDEGFKVSKVSVADKDGKDVKVAANADGTYSFEMPSGGATVTVEFACDGGELCPSHGLVDVDPGEWYHEAVDWAVSTGLMTGYDDGSHTFGPDDQLTRAQLAQILYNRAGKPAADGDVSQFSDCASGAWYAPAVSWAADRGLLKGYDGQGTFGPDDVLTREQLAIVFWRIAGEPAAEADLTQFPDGSETSPWAEGAVEWAVSTGLLQGYDNTGELDPAGDITRAQAATVFMREADAE
ncbi:S-layer homology domain-containing protein [Collinsella sp. An2]|uniref:S-layer homology domain-containing protein n=1 Tax=Collinsella sp. An2 TaxID=1965585 RepID=UPI0013020F53|nr:S-layer homology domain-containing protein [Collinsella sp. An2]